MRYLVLAGVLALAGCSSQWVRCERHLTPINGARTTEVEAVGLERVEGRGRSVAGNAKNAEPVKTSPSKGGSR